MSDSPWMPPSQDREQPPLEPSPAPSPESRDDASPWSREGASFAPAPPIVPEPVPQPAGEGVPVVPVDPWAAEGPDVPGDAPAAAVDGEMPPAFGEPVAPAPARRRRSPIVLALGVAAVVAIGLAAIFAVRRMTGETSSGAETPDALGQELLDAIEGEDVLGVIDALLPGERDSLGEPFVEMVSELQRLDVLSSDLDLSRLAGLDVQLTNRVVDVAPTNVTDIVNVALRADVVASVDGELLPIGELIEERMPPDMLLELRGSKRTETDSLDVTLAAVLDDGRWYFSLLHTAAESLRDLAGDPIPDEGVDAVGAESPEAAVEALFDRLEQLDLRGMVQALDPYEARALQRYAPLFLDDAEAAIAEQAGDVTVSVTDRVVRVEGSGGSRSAFIDGLTVAFSADGVTTTMSVADGCVRFESDDVEPVEQCGGVDATAVDGLDLGEEGAALVAALTDAFADLEPSGLELRERDGAWYVSPMATLTEAMLNVVRALDRAEIERIADVGTEGAEQLADAMFSRLFDAGLGLGANDFDDLDGLEEFEVEVTEGDVGQAVETLPIDDCYMTPDAQEAAACFDGLLATGQAEPWEVPVALRFPECGIAEANWSGSYYDLEDVEFIDLMTGAQSCFQGLVDAGEIEEWEVPYEVAHVACFEGRNWFNVFDEAYTTRVFDCVAAEGS